MKKAGLMAAACLFAPLPVMSQEAPRSSGDREPSYVERLDKNPNAMRTRRETVEHPFGTMKMRMGATHFLTKTLPKVATEMALCVLTYKFDTCTEHCRRRAADGGNPRLARVVTRAFTDVWTPRTGWEPSGLLPVGY